MFQKWPRNQIKTKKIRFRKNVRHSVSVHLRLMRTFACMDLHQKILWEFTTIICAKV